MNVIIDNNHNQTTANHQNAVPETDVILGTL